MNKEEKIKIIKSIILKSHKKIADKIGDFEIKFVITVVYNYFFTKDFREKEYPELSEIKIKIFKLIDILRYKYEKDLGQQFYLDIIEKINKELPIFPNWEEYQFKKLMEKTFTNNHLNDINYYPYKQDLYNKTWNKY